MTDDTTLHTAVLIVGAGPVGMTLARALADTALTVTLLDRRRRGSHRDDPRALALSHGARELLDPLGAWNANAATAIADIHVSQAGGIGRTRIAATEHRLPALGYVMRYRDLVDALDATLADDAILDNAEIVSVEPCPESLVVTIRRNDEMQKIATKLLVHAEGTPPGGEEISVRDYRQHAVLAEVKTASGHGQRAWERFTPDGPLALLPLDDGYSIVFTVPPDKADELMQMDDRNFLTALGNQFGDTGTGLPRFVAATPRARFPLALRMRRQLVAHREIWIGNAAQTLHPVSGQGFNLGLRDAWELARRIAHPACNDPGGASLLEEHVRNRRTDRYGSALFTDGIVRIFSNDSAPLRFARGTGLLALDLCPPLRRFISSRMIWGARAWPW